MCVCCSKGLTTALKIKDRLFCQRENTLYIQIDLFTSVQSAVCKVIKQEQL